MAVHLDREGKTRWKPNTTETSHSTRPRGESLTAIAERITPAQGSWLADQVRDIEYASRRNYEAAYQAAEQTALDSPIWIAKEIGGWFMRARLEAGQ
jgi:hypothetical protein